LAVAAYTAGYKPFSFTDFSGGLNLRDKADAIGDKEAMDVLNVTFTERGAIRQRDGYVDHTPGDLTNRVDSLAPYYNAAGSKQLVAGCDTRIEVVSSGGVVVGSTSGLLGGPWSFARFGDPLHEYLYAANGLNTFQRWNGSTWATGDVLATVNGVANVAMPRAGALCVTASTPGATSGTNASNRLIATAYGTQVNAGPGGTESTPSRVHFSNAGQPEVWETDGDPGAPGVRPVRGRNFIDLTPGDGERIMAAVTWRELVFIFKETKFFVLWGEGTAADGTPTFMVREVVNAIGLATAQAVAVGRDGVYFMNRRGVYRTSGGDPTLLSDVISPMWTQDPDVYFQSSPINLARIDQTRMLWHMERLYVAIPTGEAAANDRVLVFDTQHGWWSLYDFPASSLASFRADVRPVVCFGYSIGPNRIARQQLHASDDRGQRITSRWRSGWLDFGASQQRTIRERRVWGSGAVVVSPSTDYNPTSAFTADVILGALAEWPVDGAGTWNVWLAPIGNSWPSVGQISDALIRRAIRGVVFSIQFSNSTQAATWSVHRIARHVREVREPSVR
jgi:hypothetical protein